LFVLAALKPQQQLQAAKLGFKAQHKQIGWV
jgi:hypothetical protein